MEPIFYEIIKIEGMKNIRTVVNLPDVCIEINYSP